MNTNRVDAFVLMTGKDTDTEFLLNNYYMLFFHLSTYHNFKRAYAV